MTSGSDEELKELRRDLAEAQATATRTHHALTTLSTTLKEVVERQDKYERGLSLNSFVAYALFTVLLGGGFYFLYRGASKRLAEVQTIAEKARLDAVHDAEAARKELATREEGAKKAAELLALVKDGKRAELIARAPELANARVSQVEKEVIEEAAAKAKADIVDQSFAAGSEAARLQQWKRAETELGRALGYEGDSPRAIQARAQLGVAMLKLGDLEPAARELDAAIAGGAERTVPELRYYLATALEQAKQAERARVEYTKFADSKPMHPWAQMARRKAAILARGGPQPAPAQ